MQLYPLRVALLITLLAGSTFALADQKIKTKSNIKNDRLAESSSAAACIDTKGSCKKDDASGAASSVSAKPAEKSKAE